MRRVRLLFVLAAITFIANGVAAAQGESSLSSKLAIQNTFYGLTFGQEYTVEVIKAAVSKKSESPSDITVERDINGWRIIFEDVFFAGMKWDICEILILTKGSETNGVFYMVRHYNSYYDATWENDDTKEAKKIFTNYSKILDTKYGEGVNLEQDNKNDIVRTYYGSNDTSITIYNDREKSEGGSYRRYVGITYYVRSLSDSNTSSAIDEL